MSLTEPARRSGRPSASRTHRLRRRIQAYSPSPRCRRYSPSRSTLPLARNSRSSSAWRCRSSGCRRSNAIHCARVRSVCADSMPSISSVRGDVYMRSLTMSQSTMPSFEPATASAKRSSLRRSASSVRLRSVMSTLTPAMRVAWPWASRKHCARVRIQRTPPSGSRMRYSKSSRDTPPLRTSSSTRASFARSSGCGVMRPKKSVREVDCVSTGRPNS